MIQSEAAAGVSREMTCLAVVNDSGVQTVFSLVLVPMEPVPQPGVWLLRLWDSF